MSIGYLHTWVWIGSLVGGTILSLLLEWLLPDRGIVVLSAAYLVSGFILNQTVKTYDEHDRQHFTRKHGRKMPFLMGLGGPFLLAWEFFSNLWR